MTPDPRPSGWRRPFPLPSPLLASAPSRLGGLALLLLLLLLPRRFLGVGAGACWPPPSSSSGRPKNRRKVGSLKSGLFPGPFWAAFPRTFFEVEIVTTLGATFSTTGA